MSVWGGRVRPPHGIGQLVWVSWPLARSSE